MAVRIPLVVHSGEIQQLQSGDSINVPYSGAVEITQTNANSGSIVIGQAVYSSSADNVNLAEANASGTSKVIGLVATTSISTTSTGQIAVDGILSATTGQWDAIAGTTGGLTFGTNYYLSPSTAGSLTSTAPSTTGQYIVLIGIAISTTELRLNIQPRILL